jgi:hypothetical protein
MGVSAPYAVNEIPLYLTSVTGMKYRYIHCIECGTAILERNSDEIYRFNDEQPPVAVHISSLPINAMCSNCAQRYTLHVSLAMTYDPDGPALYMQPQTIQLAVEPVKKLRDYHCMEDGKSMNLISDRIAYVSDNRVPFEHVDPAKVGPIGTYCPSRNCHQYWSIMV